MSISLRRGVTAALLPLLTACGGGGDTEPALLPTQGSNTTSSCPGAATHCSGSTLLRTDYGIGVTPSGVQIYGVSTNDLQTPNPAPTQAYGLLPAEGGLADVRIQRNSNGQLSNVQLLLSNLGLSWDGRRERPLIIETFEKRQGRVTQDANGVVQFGSLPPPTDLNFYDFARRGAAGTQANYANNSYFPRTEPVRCPSDFPQCPTIETEGLRVAAGDWRTGGDTPDNAWAVRLHSDGATQAGLGTDSAGNLVPLPGSTGVGVPYPGFKGFRDYHQWSYAYANLAAWITQDTVMINEWGGNNEHNKMRRGLVAFGALTPAAQLPSTGIVRYRGRLRGWFSYDASEDSYPVFGEVDAEVDFARRSVTLSFRGTRIDEGTLDPVPLGVTTTAAFGTAPLANYFSGGASNGTVAGGLAARFFGPVTGGGSGNGPEEIGGNFQLRSAGSGPVAIGGFLLRKR